MNSETWPAPRRIGEAGLEGLSAQEVADRLALVRHPEGGYFRETYRSAYHTATACGERALCTVILYLVTAAEPSRLHRLRFDELWLFHAGAALELVVLGESCKDRAKEVSRIVLDASCPQVLVPGGCWMGARVIEGQYADWGAGHAPERRWTPDRRSSRIPDWTLVGCVVAPGFEFEDFELGNREQLLRDFPQAASAILGLT